MGVKTCKICCINRCLWWQVGGSTENSRDGTVSSADKDDIMRTLLSHEKSTSSSAAAAAAAGGATSTQSSSNDSDVDDEFATSNSYSGIATISWTGTVLLWICFGTLITYYYWHMFFPLCLYSAATYFILRNCWDLNIMNLALHFWFCQCYNTRILNAKLWLYYFTYLLFKLRFIKEQ